MIEIMFERNTFNSDIILNYYLFQKFKLIKRDKFNYLTNILTIIDLLTN
jgi:hypothetical protein